MSDTTPKTGPDGNGNVAVMLAHPLNPRDLANLGVDPDTDSNVNDVITVTRDQAISLIAAGYVQVDPDDRIAVTRLIEGDKAATDVMPSATSGNAETKNLKGEALDAALQKRGLPVEGTADEKRAAVVRYDAQV